MKKLSKNLSIGILAFQVFIVGFCFAARAEDAPVAAPAQNQNSEVQEQVQLLRKTGKEKRHETMKQIKEERSALKDQEKSAHDQMAILKDRRKQMLDAGNKEQAKMLQQQIKDLKKQRHQQKKMMHQKIQQGHFQIKKDRQTQKAQIHSIRAK